jgi:hypothetical protein
VPAKRTATRDPRHWVDGSGTEGNYQSIEIIGPRSAFTASMAVIFCRVPSDIGSSFMQQNQRFEPKFSRPVALWHKSMGHVSRKYLFAKLNEM